MEGSMSEPQAPRVRHKRGWIMGVRLDPVFIHLDLG